MSETASNTATPAGGESGGDDAEYQGIVDALNSGELSTADEPSDEGEEETPEGIPSKDTLKVNGKTIEKNYSEIKEMAQKYEATQQKLETAKKEAQDARRMKTELTSQQDAVKQLLGVLAKGDIETVADFVDQKLNGGKAFNEAVIKYALKLFEHSKMSPEQREALENKKLIEKYRREAETNQKEQQQRQFEMQVNQWSEHIGLEVPKALKEVGLPDTQFVREHVITTWRNALERGQNPTAAAVASFVKKRLDESGINIGAQKAQAPQQQPRPRATPETTATRSRLQRQEPTHDYMPYSEWQKTRGR
jgi:hypothetical protein